MDTYFAPNKTIRQLNELVKSGPGMDPLKDFAKVAHEDLRFRRRRGHVSSEDRPTSSPARGSPSTAASQ